MLISQALGNITLLSALVLALPLGCSDGATASSVSASTAKSSARAFSSAELAWAVASMPEGHPLRVTGAAIRSAVELDGEIAVVFYFPLEKMEPEKQARKVLELMRPSFPKAIKVVVAQPEKQGTGDDDGFVFMHRGDDWRRDATAEETALVKSLISDVPGDAPSANP